MEDIIIFSGAPGSGKTTVAEQLQQETKSPLIDFGDLRAWHLNFDWSNANAEEEEMAFENLIFVLKNYLKHGYKNIIVTDLKDERAPKLVENLKDVKTIIISLILSDEEGLKKRVLAERNSGFKNVDEALRRNKEIMTRELFPNEHRIDNSHNEPEKTVKEILNILKK